MIKEAGDIATLAVGVAILAFLWNLRRRVAELREREEFTKGDPTRM